MLGVLTHHWAKADRVDEAKKLLDGNGLAQSKAPGFVSRQTLYSTGDPTKITTLVVWTSNDIYDQWRASPERAVAMKGAEGLWSKLSSPLVSISLSLNSISTQSSDLPRGILKKSVSKLGSWPDPK